MNFFQAVLIVIIFKYCNAAVDITSTYYYKVNEGLTSITGSDIWSTLCNSDSCETFDLSYNSFISTNLSAIDFRNTPNDELENRVKHLDLSNNAIADVSLEVFTTAVQIDSAWTIVTLDLSYNQISSVSNFPTLIVGQLKILRLQHNQISQLGTPTANALAGLYVDYIREINLEYNQITEMPVLGSGTFIVSNAVINVKNNQISQVDLSSCPGNTCGYWYLKFVDFQNNELSVISAAIVEENWDTEIFNFNNKKTTYALKTPHFIFLPVVFMSFFFGCQKSTDSPNEHFLTS